MPRKNASKGKRKGGRPTDNPRWNPQSSRLNPSAGSYNPLSPFAQSSASTTPRGTPLTRLLARCCIQTPLEHVLTMIVKATRLLKRLGLLPSGREDSLARMQSYATGLSYSSRADSWTP